MKNMKVKMKLLVSFFIVIVLTILVGIIGIVGTASLNKAATDMYDYNFVPMDALGDMREAFGAQRSDLRNIFLSQDDPAKVKSLINGIVESDKNIEEVFKMYESAIHDMSGEASFFAAKETWLGPYADMKKEIWRLVDAGDYDAAYGAFLGAAASCIGPITNGLKESTEKHHEEAIEANAHTDTLYALVFGLAIAIMAVAVAVGIILAFYISGLISKPLSMLTGFMQKAGSTGDISLRPEDVEVIGKFAQGQDEIGQTIGATASFVQRVTEVSHALETIAGGDLTINVTLLSDSDTMGISLQTMLSNMNNMFTEINSATDQVSMGSKQIADGATSLAAGATEQASSVQELAASLGDVSTSTNQNADMAKEAAGLSNTIKTSAERGSTQMDQMMQAVTDINEASGSISKVIKVIDDIAFQTNILALNAAVEAARAGQHGKGFAVVAEEVRNLAAKSAEAAKDTSALIANSIEKANFGMSIATETSESLHEIVDGINHNAEIIIKIEESSEDQARAITQINVGIDQVAQVVQQNSATAEESAASSEELSGQAEMLKQLIQQFKLK